jgi:hypothetical protein
MVGTFFSNLLKPKYDESITGGTPRLRGKLTVLRGGPQTENDVGASRGPRKKRDPKLTNKATKLLKTKDRHYEQSQTNPNEPNTPRRKGLQFWRPMLRFRFRGWRRTKFCTSLPFSGAVVPASKFSKRFLSL